MTSKKIVKVLSLSLLLSVLIAMPVLGGDKEYADQQQIESNGEYGSVSVTVNHGQKFRPEIKGRLTSVDLELQKAPGTTSDNIIIQPGDLNVEIVTVYEGIGTSPYLEVLAAATVNQADVSEQSPTWYRVTFENPAVLRTDRQYAILLRVAGPAPDTTGGSPPSYSWFLNSDDVTDPYPSGTFFFTKGNSTSFGDWMRPMTPTYVDATFITYMAHGLR